MNGRLIAASLALCPVVVSAQAPSAPIPPVAEQIAAAILPLPADMRANARVLGYKTGTTLELLRDGKNGMTCLALYVTRPDFHVACYHDGLEAFMARGRELRANGITRLAAVDSARYHEIETGKLKMPAHGALYSLTGSKAAWNPATGTVTGASPLAVLYIPFATPESTGISTQSNAGGPWLMFPGTAKAHVMIVGKM